MRPLSYAVACILFLLNGAIAEQLTYRDGPIPVGIQPTFAGARNTQVDAPGSIDLTGLKFASQQGDVIDIDVIFFRKDDDNDKHPYYLANSDMKGILNPNYCNSKDISPVINKDSLEGFHFKASLLADGTLVREPAEIQQWKFNISESGDYALVFSTCQENKVYAEGVVNVRSSYGYLPKGQVRFFYMSLTIGIFALLLTFRYGIRLWCNSSIVGTLTEKTIFWALSSMTLQTFVLVSHFVMFNRTGVRPHFIIYGAMLLDLVKHALTFGVAVMMSLGQGYSKLVVALGAWYIAVSLVMEVLRFIMQEYRVSNYDVLSKIFEVSSLLYYGTDVVVILMVLCFISRTMRYLKRANQLSKLRRYRAFLSVLLLILTATVGAVFADQFRFYVYSFAVSELSFLAVITAMSWLWWPSPDNQDYERLMQLPELDPDGNELVSCNENVDEEFGGLELNATGEEDMFAETTAQ